MVREDRHNTGKLRFAGVRAARAGHHPFFTFIHLFLACGPRASQQCCPQDFISSRMVRSTPKAPRERFASEGPRSSPGAHRQRRRPATAFEAELPTGRDGEAAAAAMVPPWAHRPGHLWQPRTLLRQRRTWEMFFFVPFGSAKVSLRCQRGRQGSD